MTNYKFMLAKRHSDQYFISYTNYCTLKHKYAFIIRFPT